MAVAGWWADQRQATATYLVEESRLLGAHLRGRIKLTDEIAIRKWRGDVRRRLGDAGIRVALTPLRAPNANAYAERFVRSIKEECLDRMIPLGDRHFRRAVAEFVDHYHRERNHQGLENALIAAPTVLGTTGRVHRRPRLGGQLNYYERAA